jgi:hypothetical protein
MATFLAAFPSLANPHPEQDTSAVQIRHLCLALRLVNARLSSKDAVSNETLIAVLILGLYERYQGDFERGLVHLEGVRRMLDMRGGIREFAATGPSWARKVFR